jgi:hypothetical protein
VSAVCSSAKDQDQEGVPLQVLWLGAKAILMFVKLTQPNGKPVWIKADSIARIQHPVDRGDANALLNGEQAVREYPEDVIKLIIFSEQNKPS